MFARTYTSRWLSARRCSNAHDYKNKSFYSLRENRRHLRKNDDEKRIRLISRN